jgi:hypothetical protein
VTGSAPSHRVVLDFLEKEQELTEVGADFTIRASTKQRRQRHGLMFGAKILKYIYCLYYLLD